LTQPIDWPVWRKLARPKPSPPSPRVYAAFAIALIIGVATFLIWWITSDVRLRQGSGATVATKPSVEAVLEAALPRGGSLTGSTDAMNLAMERLTGASLVRVNRSTDELESWLAESFTAAAGNLIYMVRLRPGLTSADGTLLTAASAATSLSSLTAKGRPVAVQALDPLTLEIRFSSPFAPGLRVLDQHVIAGFGPFAEVPGPKRPGLRTAARFKRNPNYWRKAADGSPLPYLDEIVLTSPTEVDGDFSEAPIRAEDFEALKKLEQSGKARLFELGPGLDADALWISSAPPGAEERPWLTSETLRMAISTAVDRREYCKQVFYGACDPMAGPVSPSNVKWFNPDFPLGQANPQLARAMLAELGLRDRNGDGLLDDAARRPLRFTLLIRRDVSSSARAATFLADTLKTIGVQMDVTPLAAEALAARRQKGTYDAIYDRIEMRDTDPAMNLDFWMRSGPRLADWERQMNELMMKNAESFDRIERLQAFIDAQKIYLQHMPAIFFGAPHIRMTTSPRTLNATPSPLRPHLLWNAENLARLDR
jgi:ABC-type transport system substrate-binding protein